MIAILKTLLRFSPLFAAVLLLRAEAASVSTFAEPPPAFALLTNALVDSEGIFLPQLVRSTTDAPPLHVKLAAAPAPGQAVVLTRQQISEALAKASPGCAFTNWTGAQRVRVSRRMRPLDERELREMLSETLQKERVMDRGELELRFNRAWPTISIPDEPCSVRFLDLPYAGVTPNMVVRFELNGPNECFGNWQASLTARIWRDIPFTRAPLRRGQILVPDDLVRERADILTMRNLVRDEMLQGGLVEALDNVQAGVPLLARHVRAKPIVYRGQQVEALVQEGALSIVLRVEALEDGTLGQTVRVRNTQTRRELRGRVRADQSVLVIL